jgi:26S proteasome regulatory subunit N8
VSLLFDCGIQGKADRLLVENRIANAQREIEDAKSPEERKAEEAAAAKAAEAEKAKKEAAESKDKK